MSIRTFLVEDDAVMRSNLTDTLQQLADVKVVGFEDGVEKASEWLTTHLDEWDLAIVDLFLLDGSGLAVLGATHRRSSSQRVVVMSNHPTLPMHAKCRALGANRVFDKSTQVDELINYCLDFGKIA